MVVDIGLVEKLDNVINWNATIYGGGREGERIKKKVKES